MSSFTHELEVTRRNTPIPCEEGEPIRMLVPQRRRELEVFAAAVIGETPSGLRVKEYQASLRLRAFAEDSADAGQSDAAKGRGSGTAARPRAGSR